MKSVFKNNLISFSLIMIMIASLFAGSTQVYAASGDTIVYITKTGECYHSSGCSSLSRSKIETTLQQAVNKGLRPCSKCNPGTLDTTSSSTEQKTDKVAAETSKKETVTTSKSATNNSKTTTGKASVNTSKSKKSTTSKSSGSTAKSSKNGSSTAKTTNATTDTTKTEKKESSYVANTSTKKFHKPSCASADKIKAENRLDYTGTRDDLIGQGYDPCKKCNP